MGFVTFCFEQLVPDDSSLHINGYHIDYNVIIFCQDRQRTKPEWLDPNRHQMFAVRYY